MRLSEPISWLDRTNSPELSKLERNDGKPSAPKPLSMSTMNISLPDLLRDFVDEQVASRGYGTSSEYVLELIRRDQDRLSLRALMLEGAESALGGEADAAYFTALRERAAGRKPSRSCSEPRA